MTYTNSSLIDCTVKSPNYNTPRTHKIDYITPHCVVGQLTAKSIGNCFTSTRKGASCNYGIGSDGKICLIVDEANRSWCSSSKTNDQRAVTIECASEMNAPYAMTATVYNTLVKLCADICKRNGIKKLLWLGTKEKTLSYEPKDGEAVLTAHRWYANKDCPGDWLYNRYGQLATDVNNELVVNLVTSNNTFKNYIVRITSANGVNIRKGPGTNFDKVGAIAKGGAYTIVSEAKGTGASLWGKLKSGAGWIALDFTEKIR